MTMTAYIGQYEEYLWFRYCNSITTVYSILNFIKFLNLSRQLENIDIVAVHQKGNKQLMENYCPVSFLSISTKIFKILVF